MSKLESTLIIFTSAYTNHYILALTQNGIKRNLCYLILLPLTIYLLAFLPAILNIVTIAGGQQMVRSGAISVGSLVMWSGNALLAACFTLAYTRWARH